MRCLRPLVLLCWWCFSASRLLFDVVRHSHHRYINLKLRVSKRGRTTTDVQMLRFYSCFAEVPEGEIEQLGSSNVVRCSAQHLNLPLLYQGLMSLAMEHPQVSMDPVALYELPLFTSTSARTQRGAVSIIKAMTDKEINARFGSDLARIGENRVNGQRPCRMYGFRRGGAQDLLDRTGQYELVMRMGDWRPNSDSFLVYLTNMHSRGTLRSTLRSYRQADVTQAVAQVTQAHSQWVLSNIRKLRSLVGRDLDDGHAEIVGFERDAVQELARILCEVTLVLRNGDAAAAEEKEPDNE